MLSIALAALLVQADAGVEIPDAGSAVPPAFGGPIYAGCPTADADVPAVIPVAPFLPDGGSGWLLPHPRGPRIACLLAACEVNRQSQEERLDAAMSSTARSVLWLSIGASAAASIAAGVVWVRDELSRPRIP